ncbi:uncharacterized protein LOC126659651 [Mercurialis annua]|uniref:uncharacterized protein LOC126659651 n=1 Tax=Mercurialis annua TaxID=3986 RepID=UPI00215FC741|nr:uncharacterized protein LOC126659651 [Mercurialis annua]
MSIVIKIPYEAMLSSFLEQLKLPSQTYEFDESEMACRVCFSYEHPASKTMVSESCVARTDTADMNDAKEKVSEMAIEFLKETYGFEILDYSSTQIPRLTGAIAELTAYLDHIETKTKILKKKCEREEAKMAILEKEARLHGVIQ